MGKKHRKIAEVGQVSQPEPPKAPSVPLSVFTAACGIRHDQLAGFKAWARNESSKTMGEWRNLLDEYRTRPVK